MSDYKVTVTIKTDDILPKNLKKIQRVKAELEKEVWQMGNTWEKAQIVEFFPRQILQQNLNLVYTSYGDIVIFCNDIDRKNLKQMEKIIGIEAKLETQDGKMRLSFDLSRIGYKSNDIKFPTYKNRNDIPMDWGDWRCEVHGYTWKTRPFDRYDENLR